MAKQAMNSAQYKQRNIQPMHVTRVIHHIDISQKTTPDTMPHLNDSDGEEYAHISRRGIRANQATGDNSSGGNDAKRNTPQQSAPNRRRIIVLHRSISCISFHCRMCTDHCARFSDHCADDCRNLVLFPRHLQYLQTRAMPVAMRKLRYESTFEAWMLPDVHKPEVMLLI